MEKKIGEEKEKDEHDSDGERKKSSLLRVLRLILPGKLDWKTKEVRTYD